MTEEWDEHRAWVYALASTAAISIVPTLILPFIPSWASKPGSGPLKIMLMFAVGGMIGDVFLHLIPHLMMNAPNHSHTHVHEHEHEHEHSKVEYFHKVLELMENELHVGLNVLAGFLFFFLAERIIRVYTDHSHHSHSHVEMSKKNDDLKVKKGPKNPKGKLKVGGLLNLVADFMHNVTDGLAIGAAFSTGHSLGMATTLSTIFHELPHEIGDYAVLVQSGISPWKAIGAQFCTAFGALLGTLIGLSSSHHAGGIGSSTLLAFTAGGFIYVSCVSVMPEVLNSRSGIFQSAFEIIAFATGIALMVLVAALE